MDRTWLDHQLTPDEAADFERGGYFVIPDAITPDQVARLSAAVEQCRDWLHTRFGVSRLDTFNLLDFIGLDDAFLELIDHPRTFPKLWRILGWNIQLYHSHMIVTPPLDDTGADRRHFIQSLDPALNRTDAVPAPDETWRWHRDSGQVNDDLFHDLGTQAPQPRLSVKIAYYLSDAHGDNDANMVVVPGSHVDPSLSAAVSDPPPATAVPVRVGAGSAVFFDRRILHSSSANLGVHTRQVLFYGYSYRWFRPRDEMSVAAYLRRSDPIRRQLLGFSHTAFGYTSPEPEDVPLRAWLEEHGCIVPSV